MNALIGKRVLVVEDEAIIAAMVEDMLTELGVAVIGPASSIAKGLALASTVGIDAAVLDVNIRSERVDPIVDLLKARRVPFVYATGYGSSVAYGSDTPIIEKPYTAEKLAVALEGVIKNARLA